MQCSEKVSKDISQFMAETGLNEAFLFGGAVIDPLVFEQAKISDYDLCVRTEDDFYKVLRNLDKTKIGVSEVMRTHNIYVVIHHPTLGQIDFSCMNPEDNGIFNIEKIYARFVRENDGYSNEVIDKYGAVDGLKRGEIRIASNPKKEGAYNVLRRFLAISGKYNLDISKGGPNQSSINFMNNIFQYNYPYIPQDKVRCLSRLVASVKRASDRQRFVNDLSKQGILRYAFGEIDELLKNDKFRSSEKLQKAESQKEILELMMEHVPADNRDELIDCLIILQKREEARQDKGVKEFLSGVNAEKTSIQRLNNRILTPLLSYCQRREIL